MSFMADALISFTFGAHEALLTPFDRAWPVFLPSFAAMVLTAAGHLRPRDLVAIFSLPAIAAAAWGTFAVLRQDAGLHHTLLGFGSHRINAAMLSVAFLLIAYVVICNMTSATARLAQRRTVAYAFVWALCATNLPLIYHVCTGPALRALDYGTPTLALGWITGQQAGFVAAFLVPPALAGVMRTSVPVGLREATSWLAIGLYAVPLVLLLLILWPSL